MKFFVIISLLAAIIGACGSFERNERQEQQAVDSFDVPVGDDSVTRDPYGNQPR